MSEIKNIGNCSKCGKTLIDDEKCNCNTKEVCNIGIIGVCKGNYMSEVLKKYGRNK